MSFTRWFFGLAALPYDWMTAHPVWEDHCRQMASLLPSGQRRQILDLGCGPGVSTRALAGVLHRDRLIGVDFSEPMLRRALNHDVQGACLWTRADAGQLPFRDGSVDAITAHSFLYLLPDRRRALAEMRRVLRPGGNLILMEPTAQGSAEALASLRESLRVGGIHLAFTMACWRIAARSYGPFTDAELCLLLEAEGFEGITVQPTLHGLGWIATATKPVVPVSACG